DEPIRLRSTIGAPRSIAIAVGTAPAAPIGWITGASLAAVSAARFGGRSPAASGSSSAPAVAITAPAGVGSMALELRPQAPAAPSTAAAINKQVFIVVPRCALERTPRG